VEGAAAAAVAGAWPGVEAAAAPSTGGREAGAARPQIADALRDFDPVARYRDRALELFDHIRIQGDLTGKVAPWWWSGPYVAVTPEQNPRVVFMCEGCETKKVFRRGANEYEVWSRVMTVFKDPESLEILNGREFRNPFTGQTNRVEPNVIGSKSLLTVGADGAIRVRSLEGPESAGYPLRLRWTRSGDRMHQTAARDYPAQRPIPLAEFGTTLAEIAQLADPEAPRVEATFASTFLAPWQRFLAMPKQPGHSVWHAVGRKTRGFDELTKAYLEQAERYIPDVLAWDR
jgi:Protein of unknown function (DUF1838)